MSLQPKPRLTPEDYLALERSADFKSEYFNGEIFAMTGASRSHNTIVLNIGSEIRQQLKKRSRKAYTNSA
ncbi:MAG: Uma2 family endonuclease [Candidatus Competibacteraceae bacterium]|nr:MAG: Uma2 family endonuclease [Candidatus Competibacteraceae bacterium]